jgi:hypothetical protein
MTRQTAEQPTAPKQKQQKEKTYNKGSTVLSKVLSNGRKNRKLNA